MRPDNIDLACAVPATEDQWQRQCEIEHSAAHEFFLHRAKGGHSIPATVFGTIIAAALTAKAFFREDTRAETCEVLIDHIRAHFKED